MHSSFDKPLNPTSSNPQISSQDHSLSPKSLFKLSKPPSNHPKSQAIINLIPQENPNPHPSSPLLQEQDQVHTDSSSELVLNEESSQNDSGIDDTINPSPLKNPNNSTLSFTNDQTGDTTKVFRQFLAELDNMEEEKSLSPEDLQIPKSQQGEPEAQLLKTKARKEQDQHDPLENYQKARYCEKILRQIENPEDIDDEVFKSLRKGLGTLGEKMKTRKDIEAEMALEMLESFDLGKLKTTKNNVPDMRFSESKEYKWLCESARLDPKEHYKKNIMRFSQRSEDGKSTQAGSTDNIGSQSSRKSESKMIKSQKEMKESQRSFGIIGISEEILAKIEEAKRKVEEYDVSKVVFKKDKTPDKRFKQNREYILLLEQCELSYYLKR